MAKKKKCKCECPAGIPGWVVTFGDMMSLLLTFFILLLSFSSIQESKFHDAVGSIQGALGIMPHAGTSVIGVPSTDFSEEAESEADSDSDADSNAEQEAKAMQIIEDIKEELDDLMDENSSNFDKDAYAEDLLELEVTNKGVHIVINDSIFFTPGKAKLKDNFKIILKAIGKVIAKNQDNYNIVVEGHTDNTPIRTKKFPSNWELSSYRALSVVRYMIKEFKIPSQIFSATGYGEFRPIADNTTKRGKAKNRRVDMYLMKNPKK